MIFMVEMERAKKGYRRDLTENVWGPAHKLALRRDDQIKT